MNRRSLRWLGGLLVALLLGVLLTDWLAETWLQSPAGRSLLQRRMNEAVGQRVELGGGLRLALLPRPSLSGKGLRIFPPDSGKPLLAVESYAVRLRWGPLLRRELHIAALDLSGGRIDAEQMPASAGRGEPGGAWTIPRLDRLGFSDMTLALPAGVAEIHADHLDLIGLAPGRPAGLEFAGRVNRAGSTVVAASASGALAIDSLRHEFSLVLQDLDVHAGEQDFLDLAGTWTWRVGAGRLSGELAGEVPQLAGRLDLRTELTMDRETTGALRLQYRSATGEGKADLGAGFRGSPAGLEFPRVVVSVAGQELVGSGCLRSEPARFNLSLQAKELDLDALQQAAAHWSAMAVDSSSAPPALPALAIRLDAASARTGGAVAKGVTLVVGREPDCGEAAEPLR